MSRLREAIQEVKDSREDVLDAAIFMAGGFGVLDNEDSKEILNSQDNE